MPALHGTSGTSASVVQGYEILQTLNEGGMGKIYLARQHALNRLVCLKVLSIPAGDDPDECRARFCREAELLASVSHPNIVSIFDFGATADLGLPFLVIEYIEGGDLRRRMNHGEPMPLAQVRSIISQVGDALAHLSSKGILHRDLKPENILMPSDSLVKVGDFGIAVMQDKAGLLTQSGGMGTVGYVSPEQQYGLKVDERSDEFSLAAVAYELLTGRRPLGSFPRPSRLNRQLSQQLDSVVLRGLAEEPKGRFPTVREFVTAFDQALAAAPRRARFLPLAAAALVALVAALAGLNWIGGAGPRREVPVNAKQGSAESPVLAVPAHPPSSDTAKATETEANAPELSQEFHRLVELRAYVIWDKCGRPKGKEGEMVKEKNWLEAERQILEEVKARAFKIWDQQGRPLGKEGEDASKRNMRDAAIQLLKETEDEMRRNPID
jgi:serine/threonine protein kinase